MKIQDIKKIQIEQIGLGRENFKQSEVMLLYQKKDQEKVNLTVFNNICYVNTKFSSENNFRS